MNRKLISLLIVVLSLFELCTPLGSDASGAGSGDVNSDGLIDAMDASFVLSHYSSVSTGGSGTLSASQIKSGDVNFDGLTDSSDASYILTYYAAVSTGSKLTLGDMRIAQADSSDTYITSVYSNTYALYCVEDDQLISYHDIHRRVSPASFTKLLTASVALKYVDPGAVVTVGSELSYVLPYSSVCLLARGHRLTMYDLLTGMLMASGNDAAYSVAVTTARVASGNWGLSDKDAVAYFCRLMNEQAAEIGMTESNFVNPDGYDASGQYTTSADMIKLARYAITVPQIRTIASTAQKRVTIASGQVFNWKNSNLLLSTGSGYYRSDAFGLKTGTTEDSGTCLISAFNRNGKTYINVVSGCTSDGLRYDLTIRIIDTYT